jgi:hypothetical protein
LFEQIKGQFEDAKHFTIRVEGIQGSDAELFIKALINAKNQREWQVTTGTFALITLSVNRDELSGQGAFLCGFTENQICVNALAALLSADACQLDFKSLYLSSSVPAGWDDDVWQKAKQMIKKIKQVLETQDHKQFNNENVLRKLISMSNFEQLVTIVEEKGLQESRTKILQELQDLRIQVANCITTLQGKLHFIKNSFNVEPTVELKLIEEERQQIAKKRSILKRKDAKIRKELSAENIRKMLADVALDEKGVLDKSKQYTLSVQEMEELAEEYETKIMVFEVGLMKFMEKVLQGIIDTSPVALNPVPKSVGFEDIKIMARNECSSLDDDGILNINLEKERKRISYLIGKRLAMRVSTYSQEICQKAEVICKHIDKGLSKQLQRFDKSCKELDDRQNVLREIAKLDIWADNFRGLLEDINSYIKTIEQ